MRRLLAVLLVGLLLAVPVAADDIYYNNNVDVTSTSQTLTFDDRVSSSVFCAWSVLVENPDADNELFFALFSGEKAVTAATNADFRLAAGKSIEIVFDKDAVGDGYCAISIISSTGETVDNAQVTAKR